MAKIQMGESEWLHSLVLPSWHGWQRDIILVGGLSPLSLSLLLSLFSSPSRSDSTTATSSQCTKHTCHFVLFHAQQHVWPLPWEWPRLGQRHQRWCTGGMYAPWTSNAHLRWPLLTGKELYNAKLVVQTQYRDWWQREMCASEHLL